MSLPDRFDFAATESEIYQQWLDAGVFHANAADSTRFGGDRTGGAPVAPTGVPKGDHVANPLEADRQAARVEATKDTGGAQIESSDRY